MPTKIKLAGTTSNTFQVGLQGVTISTVDTVSPYTLTLPADTGNSGQLLSTDGTGNLSWATGYANSNVYEYLGSSSNVDILTTGNISVTGNLSAGYSQFSSNVIIAGNLSVTGNITYIDIENSVTSNLVWQSANSAVLPVLANGGGLAVGPVGSSYATWLYNSTSNTWTTTIGIGATGNITGGNVLAETNLRWSTGNAYISKSATAEGSISLIPDTNLNAINGVIIGGSGYILGPNAARNAVLNYGAVSGTIGFNNVNIYGNTTTAIATTGNGVGNIGSSTNRFNTILVTNVDAIGNISGNYISGNGVFITNVDADALQGFGPDANATPSSIVLRDTSGNVRANTFVGNVIQITANITSAANITGGNILTSGIMSSTGNAIHGNILTSGLISATANITSAANITGGNILTSGLISATGNITGGNVITAGLISATGNVTGGNVSGTTLTGNLVGTTANLSGNLVVTNSTGNITLSTTSGSNIAIAMGSVSGLNIAGDRVAIGNNAGNGQSANSIVINAAGGAVSGTNAGFYVNPVRVETTEANIANASAGNIAVYNTTTKELTAISIPEFSATSSATTAVTAGYAYTIIPWTETSDSHNWFASNRYTPQRSGWYQISCAARSYTGDRTQESIVALRKNGNIIAISDCFGQLVGTISQLVYMNGSTDYLDVAITNAVIGTTAPVQSPTTTFFTGYWVRP